MVIAVPTLATFDGAALIRALDEQRAQSRLTWNGVAGVLTDQSAELRARMNDHAVCGGALTRTVARQTMTCQYALMLLRWLDRVPEDFLAGGAVDVGSTRLPRAGSHERLRWDLPALHAVLDEQRRAQSLTWGDLARAIECSPSRLTNLKNAREADMGLVMRVTQRVQRPSVQFIHAVSE